MAKLKQITVQGTVKDNKVALWERHEDHPKGEAFVVNDGETYTVAETKLVRTKLAEGSLTTEVAPKKEIQEQRTEGNVAPFSAPEKQPTPPSDQKDFGKAKPQGK